MLPHKSKHNLRNQSRINLARCHPNHVDRPKGVMRAGRTQSAVPEAVAHEDVHLVLHLDVVLVSSNCAGVSIRSRMVFGELTPRSPDREVGIPRGNADVEATD